MFKRPTRILFIGHMANRSGAPVLLLELIKEFKRQSDLPFAIILRKGGELEAEYRELGKTYVWEIQTPEDRSLLGKIKRVTNRAKCYFKRVRIKRAVQNTSHVFSNTITNGDLLRTLHLSDRIVFTYVHELEAAIAQATTGLSLQNTLKDTSFFFTGSQAVQQNLVRNHGVSASRIEVIYSSLPVLIRDKKIYAAQVNRFLSQYSISPHDVVVGIAAGTEWRKGVDLFLPLVLLYKNLFGLSNVHFVWMGVKLGSDSERQLLYDLNKLNLGERVHLIAHGSEYLAMMAAFDIHVLLSREDPYPLVVLDAASFAIPTICFEDAGGSPEFIEKDSGYCVPYLDLNQMALQINYLVTHPECRSVLGNNARVKVGARHDQSLVIKKIIGYINSVV